MKKVLSFVLALVMVMALSVTAFAVDYTDVNTPKENNVEVTAGYTAGVDTKGATTYKFNVFWNASDISLKYVGEQAEYVWDVSDSTNLHYRKDVKNDDAGWSGSYVLDVTVTNYSNAALSLKTTATATQDLFNITNIGDVEQTVANAAVDSNKGEISYTDTVTKGSEQTATVSYKFAPKANAGAPTGASGTSITVGHVNITVDKVTPVAP